MLQILSDDEGESNYREIAVEFRFYEKGVL